MLISNYLIMILVFNVSFIVKLSQCSYVGIVKSNLKFHQYGYLKHDIIVVARRYIIGLLRMNAFIRHSNWPASSISYEQKPKWTFFIYANKAVDRRFLKL